MPDRIQREVEELLDRLEKFPPRRPLGSRLADAIGAPFRALSRVTSGLHLPSLSAGHVLLIAIAVIVIAYVALDSTDVGRWLIVGGIILFIGAFVFSMRRTGPGRPQEKYWRDRPLDLRERSGGRSWWDRFRGR